MAVAHSILRIAYHLIERQEVSFPGFDGQAVKLPWALPTRALTAREPCRRSNLVGLT
jgi:hypothetical protein